MNNQPTIIDVRTPAEYSDGHIENSVNIPLDQIPSKIDVIKKMKQPLLLCCASGNRSGQAEAFLRSQGIDCKNGGGWMEVYRSLKSA